MKVSTNKTAKAVRMQGDPARIASWKQWGPFLSERQWGTVREDYSPNGTAWDYFPHDHARSRAYRWGEDGLGGFSDDQQRLCLAVALWHGKDPILKERLFGLTNSEGNHGEDVKELYYFQDALPSHSYLRMLYKYRQRFFPYEELMGENRRRGIGRPEYELVDTGIFDDDRYFDVVIEYAKAGPDDILLRITAHNRGPEAAELHLLPQLWFRNTWSWQEGSDRPQLMAEGKAVAVQDRLLGDGRWQLEGSPTLLFTENETNVTRLYGVEAETGYCKDGFHQRIISGNEAAVNPSGTGTKAGAWYRSIVPAGKSFVARTRLSLSGSSLDFHEFDRVVQLRAREADEF